MNRSLLILATTAAKLTAAAPVLAVGYGVKLPAALGWAVTLIEAASVIAMLGLASWSLHSQMAAYRATRDPWLRLTAPATGLATAAVLIVPPLAGEAGAGWPRAVTLIGLAVLVLAVLAGDVAAHHAQQEARSDAIEAVGQSAPVETPKNAPVALVQVNVGTPQAEPQAMRQLPQTVQATPGLAEALLDPAQRDSEIAQAFGLSRQRVTHLRREVTHA